MIKAVLFDVGGTLIEVNPSVGQVYADVASRHGLKINPQELQQRFRHTWKTEKSNQRAINKNWWKEIVSETFRPFLHPLDPNLFEDIYAEFKSAAVWRIFPDVQPVLEMLHKGKIKTAVASNWDERLPQLLADLHLASYFDHQFISYEIGFSKPHPQFFKTCLDRLELNSTEVLHIGDDEDNDLKAAEQVGIGSYKIDRHITGAKTARVLTTLEEVLKHI